MNSRRLTTVQLRKIAEGLGLPSAGSADEIRQVIEGKLEEGHDVHNVQVVVYEMTTVNVELSLMDENGAFLNVTPFQREVNECTESEEILQRLAKAEDKGAELEAELEQVKELLTKEQEKTAQLTEELSSDTATAATTEEVTELKAKLKQKVKQMWTAPRAGSKKSYWLVRMSR